jgi:hypothetical protein
MNNVAPYRQNIELWLSSLELTPFIVTLIVFVLENFEVRLLYGRNSNFPRDQTKH